MTMSDQNITFVEAFFRETETAHENNNNITFSYIAVKQEDRFHLIQGALFFNSGLSNIAATHFMSASVRAGNYPLSVLKITGRGLVDALISGCIPTPDGDLLFKGNDGEEHGATYEPFHVEGIKAQSRYNILTIYGSSYEQTIHQPDLDWELRAAQRPYDSLQELAFEYKLGSLRSVASVEVIAFNVAAFDFTSTIRGTSARLGVFLMHGLSPSDVTIGYRIFSQGKVTTRSMINGEKMEWVEKTEHQFGNVELEVPTAAVMQCFVSYLGIAQHFGWVSGPSTVQNPKRAVYTIFDDGLSILTEFITKSGGKGRDARDLETGVAWLLWMLGFSVAHLGATDRTQDAADLIATTPKGNFAVIECTTGLLKTENKLPLLIERTERVKRGIVASNNKHLRVISVMVTSRTRAEISADLEQAEKLGVLVMTKENLEQGVINRTLLMPDADKLYDEVFEMIEASKAKHLSKELLL